MPDRYIGTVIDGRYRIDSIMGEGGMAVVYKGFDIKEDHVVAIKKLRSEMGKNEELIRRFTNESRAISVLNHPNIVKVYDIGVNAQMQYIAMEFINGITLKQYIEQRGEPLTYKESVHFLSQVLQAMQHAHDKGIVHRDIKPQNIMLLESGILKVMDFGIARLARSEIHTATDQAIGSVHYISPEQARGLPTDSRADIYSVGVMLYEMLTGRLPFDSDNAVAVAMKQISEYAVPVRQINPAIPVALEEITDKAMEKDPQQRYQSAMDMLRDVRAFMQNPQIRFDYETTRPSDTEPNGGKMSKFMKQSNSRSTSAKTGGKSKPGSNLKAVKGSAGAKKKRNLLLPITAGLTAIVVIVCAIISLNIFSASGNPLFGNVAVTTLPSVVGKAESDAVREIVLAGISEEKIVLEYQQSTIVEPGYVISQNPTAKQVKVTQSVKLIVAKGEEDVIVPDIAGMLRGEGQKAILDIGCKPYVRVIYDSTQEPNIVDSTDPVAGATAKTGDTIYIFISQARVVTTVNVPDLVGIASVADAKKELQKVGLEMSATVDEEFSDSAAGTIIDQFPKPDTEVSRYSFVRVTISKGAEPPPVVTVVLPNLVGQSYDSAAATIASLGLVPQRVEVATADPSQEGKVMAQSIAESSVVEVGTVVVLTVAKYTPSSSSTPPPSSSSAPPSSSSAGGKIPKLAVSTPEAKALWKKP